MGEGEDGYFHNYPKHVFLILANEFCERFSYYGMKAFLVLYLTDALNFDDNTATAIYHSFVVLCYFTPLLGAMIADGWLGKFKTILYISLIYIAGMIIMTITAIPFNGYYVVWAPFIGLVLIAFGTGGIKPNVSAFGGDQFSPEQARQKISFFSLFYMSINIGSLLSTIITPLIRGYVYCFDDNCYSLAFGIPAILMIVAELVFASGYKLYTRIPPGESILKNLFGCIGTAIGRRCHCCCAKKVEYKDDSSSEGGEEKTPMTKKKRHWLDYAAPDYDEQFISDVKDVLRVAWLFLPLPVFWALFDQQGSRWTLQATQMNGDVGGFIVLPDMIQVLNPLLVVILVPLFESLIYPCMDKLHIPNRALQRMGVGMIFAATAFLLAGFLQMAIDQDFPPGIPAGHAKFQFVNPSSCPVNVRGTLMDQEYDQNMDPFKNTPYMNVKVANYSFEVTWDKTCVGLDSPRWMNFTTKFEENVAYQLFTDENDYDVHTYIQTILEPTGGSESTVRFYNALDRTVDLKMTTVNTNQEKDPRELGLVENQTVSKYEEIILFNYDVWVNFPFEDGNETVYNISKPVPEEVYSQNGAVYVVILHYVNATSKDLLSITQLMEIPPWTTSIFLQVPQYFLITTGEVLFSVTGLSFAYSQAAPSMKSILTAIWLMTVAIGNVVVVIVAETGSAMSQMAEFFLFSGLMYVTTVVFAIMTMFYTYVDRNDWGAQPMEAEMKIGEINEALELHDDKIKIDLDDSEKAKELAEKKEDIENEYELPEEDLDIKL